MTITKPIDGSIFPREALHVDKLAKPIAWKEVAKGRNVIDVVNASIRNSIVSGKFAVADSKTQGTIVKGKRTIEVECCWYDWKPKTRWIRLVVHNEQIYSSEEIVEVIANIGR